MTKNKLYRICKLYQVLESYGRVKKPELLKILNNRIDFPISYASLDKDLYTLREDFDIKTSHNCHGLILDEKIDFKKKVLEYCGLIE